MKYLIIFFGFLGAFGGWVLGGFVSAGKADDSDGGSIQEAIFTTCVIVCGGGAVISGLGALVTAIIGILELFTWCGFLQIVSTM